MKNRKRVSSLAKSLKEYDEIIGYIEEVLNDKKLEQTILSAIEKSDEKKFIDKEVRFGRRLGFLEESILK